MNQTKDITTFLEKYLFTLSDKEKAEFAAVPLNVWQAANDKAISDREVNSILKSRKRAKSTLFSKRIKVPENDSYGVVLDYQGEPQCLIRYISSTVKPFNEIDAKFAQEEGLEDVSEWVERYEEAFQQEDKKFKSSTPILCQTFKLVFKSS